MQFHIVSSDHVMPVNMHPDTCLFTCNSVLLELLVSSGRYTALTRLVLLSDLLIQRECDTERPMLGLVLDLERRLCMTRLHAFTIWLNKNVLPILVY